MSEGSEAGERLPRLFACGERLTRLSVCERGPWAKGGERLERLIACEGGKGRYHSWREIEFLV